jgi:uncharacterized protein
MRDPLDIEENLMSMVVGFPALTATHIPLRELSLAGHPFTFDQQVLPDRLAIRRIGISIPGLPQAFHGYRIVHLSDLHFGPAIAYRIVMSALLVARKLNPDLIALTGDFVSTQLDEFLMPDALDRLSARDGLWAVLGNHDHWTDPTGVTRVLSQCGIQMLTNANHRIERGGDAIWLAGIDDLIAGAPDLDAALTRIPDGAVVILMAHEPDWADKVAGTGRVSLQLSGHYHGGSPRILKLTSGLVRQRPDYSYGLQHTGNLWVYTSAGAGRGSLPRFNGMPEVAEITLVPASVTN